MGLSSAARAQLRALIAVKEAKQPTFACPRARGIGAAPQNDGAFLVTRRTSTACSPEACAPIGQVFTTGMPSPPATDHGTSTCSAIAAVKQALPLPLPG
jgi:hypothetical protein